MPAEPVKSSSVVVAWVPGMLRAETVVAVKAQSPDAWFYQLDPCDTAAYARTLARHWDRADDLVIIEQDVVPPPHCIEAFATCKRLWCYHAYPVGSNYTGPMLGCTRFRAGLIAERPWAMANAARGPGLRNSVTHWQSLDMNLTRHLEQLGYRAHRHYPDAVHLHDYQSGR